MKDTKLNLIIGGGIIIVAAIIAALFIIPTESNKTTAQKPASKQSNFRFPAPQLSNEKLGKATFNWEMKSLDGKSVVLSDFKGKVIFLNLWATWCAPCLAEFPSVENLYTEMKDDVVFLMISQEEFETVKSFSSKQVYSFPIMVAEGEMPGIFESNIIPTTFIIDRSGNIVAKHVGAANWADESVKTFLKSL